MSIMWFFAGPIGFGITLYLIALVCIGVVRALRFAWSKVWA